MSRGSGAGYDRHNVTAKMAVDEAQRFVNGGSCHRCNKKQALIPVPSFRIAVSMLVFCL